MAKESYPDDWNRKYTDPQLRLRLKDEVVANDKGGKPGQWSARKAQLLKHEYERAGGGYLGEKDETQHHLSEWSAEDWQTSDGSPRARTDAPKEKGGAAKRYLPKEAWEELSESEIEATNACLGRGQRTRRAVRRQPRAGRRGRPRGAYPRLLIPT